MKKLVCIFMIPLLMITHLFAQDTEPVTDIDGNVYETVKIGNQLWLKENLKTTKYNDGTPIELISKSEHWISLTGGAYMYYEHNKTSFKDVYGALYNWYTVETGKICPAGWHVPTDMEWSKLEIFLGMAPEDADKISYRATSKGGRLKTKGTVQDSTGLWHTPNEGGTGDVHFDALPGGFSFYKDGLSYGMGSYGFWWSSSSKDAAKAWYRLLYYHSAFMSRNVYHKGYGFSIRCIKDTTINITENGLTD